MSNETPCPNCGYCPHCGRSNLLPYKVQPVWIPPMTPYSPYNPCWPHFVYPMTASGTSASPLIGDISSTVGECQVSSEMA